MVLIGSAGAAVVWWVRLRVPESPRWLIARGRIPAAQRVLTRLADPPPFGLLVLPGAGGLSTAAVYAEADRLGLGRSTSELAVALAGLDTSSPEPVNDLERAASSLDPTIEDRRGRALEAGATHAMVCGSGPTVIGLFATPEDAIAGARALSRVGVDARASKPLATSE